MIKTLILFIVIFAYGISAEVEDKAGIFNDVTKSSVNQKLSEMKSKTGKEIVIETIESTEGKNSSALALQNAKSRKVNGIYVLIAKKEKKVEIKVGNKTRDIFGELETSTFKTKLTSEFKSGNFDKGLISAVDYSTSVFTAEFNKSRFSNNYSTRARNSTDGGSSFSWLNFIIIALIIFVIFRVIGALIGRMSGNSGYNNQGYGYGNSYGGGGFFSSLLGGVFGAVAGNWLYDRFFGNDSGLYGSDHSSYSDHSDSSSGWGNDSGDDYYGDSDSFGDDGGGGGDW